MTKKPADLAGVAHWNRVHQGTGAKRGGAGHDFSCIAHALVKEGRRVRAAKVIELGCGNSQWLPQIARALGARATGVDYSPAGCEAALARLMADGVEGDIYCEDLFSPSAAHIEAYDLVYSLGLVEHFDDLRAVVAAAACFVRPGGTLFTQVPNLASFHGAMAWVWQPSLLAKHMITTKSVLERAHRQAGLRSVRTKTLGVFSLDVVAWEMEPRWPTLACVVSPRMLHLRRRIDRTLRPFAGISGPAVLAPFIATIGDKPAIAREQSGCT